MVIFQKMHRNNIELYAKNFLMTSLCATKTPENKKKVSTPPPKYVFLDANTP